MIEVGDKVKESVNTLPQTIVRRGNHFIRIEGLWVLIDGPWYDYLCSFSHSGKMRDHIRLPKPKKPTFDPMDGSLPVDLGLDTLEWYSMQLYLDDVEFAHHALRICSLKAKAKVREMFNRRIKIGWYISKGPLPCYLHQVEFEPEDWWSDIINGGRP